MKKRIKYDHIIIDAGTQIRAEIDQETVKEYAECMKRNDKFPPLDVFGDGGKVWLADGFHRFYAGHQPGFPKDVECEIHKGGRLDALKFALRANTVHGLRRSNEDKRRAVEIIFKELNGSKLSDVLVSGMCGVSDRFVAAVREEIQPRSVRGSNLPPKRIGADGKSRLLPPPRGKQPTIPPQKKKTAEGYKDKTGFPIPEEILPLWNEAEEAQGLLTQVSCLRGIIERAERTEDLIFAEVNFSSVKASLNQLYADLKCALPFAVCPKCQGLLPKDCECLGRGFVSEFHWKTCVPSEKKKGREI